MANFAYLQSCQGRLSKDDPKKPLNILALTQGDCHRAINVFTGHWPIRFHDERLEISFQLTCKHRSEMEKMEYFVCEYLARSVLRCIDVVGWLLSGSCFHFYQTNIFSKNLATTMVLRKSYPIFLHRCKCNPFIPINCEINSLAIIVITKLYYYL